MLATEVQNWLCVHLWDHWCVVWKAPQCVRLCDFKSAWCPHFLTRATHHCIFVPWQARATMLFLTWFVYRAVCTCPDSGHAYCLLSERARTGMITHTGLQQLLPTDFSSPGSINLSSHAIRQIAHVTRSDFSAPGELETRRGAAPADPSCSLFPKASRKETARSWLGKFS